MIVAFSQGGVNYHFEWGTLDTRHMDEASEEIEPDKKLWYRGERKRLAATLAEPGERRKKRRKRHAVGSI